MYMHVGLLYGAAEPPIHQVLEVFMMMMMMVVVVGGDPLLLEILVPLNRPPLERNRRF